jgi:hypothetical protein
MLCPLSLRSEKFASNIAQRWCLFKWNANSERGHFLEKKSEGNRKNFSFKQSKFDVTS